MQISQPHVCYGLYAFQNIDLCHISEGLLKLPEPFYHALYVCMHVCIRGGPLVALALRPTVVHCTSPSIYSLSNPALRMK
jgi:hypothetical protein